MKKEINLEDIANALEETMDGWEQFLNTETGEVVALADGTGVETDEELLEEIESSDCYIRLPNQYEIHEYHIMEEFAEVMHVLKNKSGFCGRCVEEKHIAILKMKSLILGWTRSIMHIVLSLCILAKEWCNENEIPYTER